MIKDQKLNKSLSGVYLLDGTLDGTQLGVNRTPTKFQRFCMKLFLGWKWASVKEMKRNK
jgi:hypothetical protein